MIQWSLSLSEAQIAMLRAMREWTTLPEKNRAESTGPFGAFSHFITHAKGLLRDGLLRHDTEKKGPDRWTVTEKGELVLRVIDIELNEIRRRHSLGDGLPLGAPYTTVRKQVEAAKRPRP